MSFNSQYAMMANQWNFNQLAEVIQIGILIVNEQGNIQYVNPYVEKLFDASFQEIAQSHVATLLPNSGVLDVLEFGEEMFRSLRIMNDKKIMIHTKPLYGKHQQLNGAVAVLQNLNTMESFDVTPTFYFWEQKVNEIIDMVSDGIMICDGSGKIQYINQAYESLFNMDHRSAIGRYLHEYAHQHQVSDMVESYVMKTKKAMTNEIEIHSVQKRAVIEIRPILKRNGKIWRIISKVREIEEHPIVSNQRMLSQTSKEESSLFEEHDFLKKLIAKSAPMRNVIMKANHVAVVDTNVLILGESGVGKEVVTEVIHKLSDRRNGPFVKINCGAIPETLLESELFGYEKGSFTGANTKGKIGLFELAQGGTIFLDEIGEIPLNLQVKLLRAIQQREIMRVGGTKVIKLDIRLIAATNRDLEQMVNEGSFREDLYYRINVVPIRIPPLRDRKEDIDALVLHFLKKYNEKYGFNKKVNKDTLDALINFSWPGNVRQLENVIERMVIMCPTDMITLDYVPDKIANETSPKPLTPPVKKTVGPLKEMVAEYEKEILIEMLKVHKTIRKTALELELDHSTLVRKLKRYHINYEEVVNQ